MAFSVVFLSLTHRFDDTRILHKEARALAEAGFTVTHVAPNYGQVAPDVVEGVCIVLYQPRGTGRMGRLLGLWRTTRSIPADCFHCNEVESWIVACVLKVARPRLRVVFDVHEHYPSRFAEGDRFPRWVRPVGGSLMKLLFRLLTPLTDHVVFAKRSVAPDFHVGPDRATFIFNYAPRRIHMPSGSPPPPAMRSPGGTGVIAVHIGGFSRPRGWPQLLQALAVMRHSEVRVVALGDVLEGEATLMAEATRLGVAERIQVIPRVSYDELFGYLVCAKVGLMLYQPGILNHVYAFPMKLYDYMLAGLPVIGPNFAPEVTPVVEGEGIGWLVDTADPSAIAAALDAVADDPAASAAMGVRAKTAARERYSWEHEAEKLVRIYRRFAAAGEPARTA